ncbi:hypothetical protein DYU05_06335 [Mucilaginibacter terrenus]|uniref:Peptidase C39 domain-containing protein n=1 Tax=Mucilaginibacter terrenus TaxID=2482727 RepID=A0A3E2NW21_9SPHI|nr:vitamin K epoxide reductase family protein [Mucilaginibacter terrenus]RFZ85216.1 hypothetical protein DYU05_06335 [Mucilaginibacter terrenus]
MIGDNIPTVLFELARRLKVPLTSTGIKRELNKHPEHYNFVGLADVLGNFLIPNGVFELPIDRLTELETPFIAHLKSRGGEFVVVTNIDDGSATIVNEVYANKKVKLEWLNSQYSGRVLVAEANDGAGEKNYVVKRRRELRELYRGKFLIAGAAFAAMCLLMAKYPDFADKPGIFASLILKLTGVVISLLLALKSIDISNPLLDKFCFINRRSDCNQVIFSDSANITDELSWAEAGLFYFLTTFLLTAFAGANSPLIQYLALAALLPAVFVLYSLYLQAFVIKQWCMLCLSILIILCADGALLFRYASWRLPLLTVDSAFLMLFCFIVPVIAWAAIKPHLKATRMLQASREQLRAIKGQNISLFKKIMADQQEVVMPPQEMTIIEGDRGANTVITIVSKPFCEACGEAHSLLSSWVSSRENIKVQLFFYVLNYDGDPETAVASHMMRLAAEHDPHTLSNAINAWFDDKLKNFDAWRANYPASQQLNVEPLLEMQKKWCEANDISSTPRLFINGKQLPNFYKLEEIKYFI